MNARPTALLSRLPGGGLGVMVVILAFSFVAIVLIPGLQLANKLTDSGLALKYAGEQQTNAALIRASLASMHDRLSNRGYIQEALDQLRDSSAKLDAGLHEMNAPRTTLLGGITGAK